MENTITADISAEQITNPDILRLHALWVSCRQDGGLPSVQVLDVPSIWCLNDLMLVEAKDSGAFEYLRYGANIALAAGFDLTGKQTSTFQGSAGRFFVQCYERCVGEHQPLYTTNVAAHAALVTGWERLLLPLADDAGTPRFILAYIRPLAFKHELLARVLDATEDRIIGLGTVAQQGGCSLDFTILSANYPAKALLGRIGPEAVGQRLSLLVPNWNALPWGRALTRSVELGDPVRLEWRQSENDSHRWYSVIVNPFAEGAVITMSDISELKDKELALERLNGELERLANTDVLTGANNRRSFFALADAEIKRSLRYAVPLSIMMIDIDDFKQVNDQLGHDMGDKVLVAIVAFFERELRIHDSLGRLGGEEFAVILPHTTEAEAYELTQRLCRMLCAQHILASDENLPVTASFGVAQYTDTDTDISGLLRRADKALYRAKQLGRSRVERASDMVRDGL
ncbi:MAG: diguanylate cyclase (GGDEF)-like protein [Gammaproteobacteria bacterium]|jgi:diguanylate cyclase (GGDEF)-like protein